MLLFAAAATLPLMVTLILAKREKVDYNGCRHEQCT
jgi:hypothetical protein